MSAKTGLILSCELSVMSYESTPNSLLTYSLLTSPPMIITSFRELIVYQKAYKLSMEIFNLTKTFPKEEKYSLTDQIRRSSRSITSNLAEAWAKKIYERHFISKLSDSLGEEFETEVWLQYSLDCQYLTIEQYNQIIPEYEEVRKLLIYMMNNSSKFCKK